MTGSVPGDSLFPQASQPLCQDKYHLKTIIYLKETTYPGQFLPGQTGISSPATEKFTGKNTPSRQAQGHGI